jgi:hypothetical protein
VNETSWAYIWRLRSHYLGTGNDNGASASNFKLIGRLARATWVHSLNAACGTCTRASTAIKGDTAVTLMGQGQRSSNVVCPTCSNHCPSKHRMIFLGTPQRSYVVSPPTTPPAMTQPNFIRPHVVGRRSQAMARMRRPASPSMTSRRACHDCRTQWQAPGTTTYRPLRGLLKEACPNHVYPIKHKHKDCDMMKNFMISGSFTRGMELDEVPDES